MEVSYESIRRWCLKLGPGFRNRLKRREGQLGDSWHIDEVFITIRGQVHYLWRAVDQDGDVIDILVQRRRDEPPGQSAARSHRKKSSGRRKSVARALCLMSRPACDNVHRRGRLVGMLNFYYREAA